MTPREMNEVILCALINGRRSLRELEEAIQESAREIRKRLDILIDVGLIEAVDGETSKVYLLTAKGAAEVKRIKQEDGQDKPEPVRITSRLLIKGDILPESFLADETSSANKAEPEAPSIVIQELVVLPRIVVRREGSMLVIAKSHQVESLAEQLTIPMMVIDKLIAGLQKLRSTMGTVVVDSHE